MPPEEQAQASPATGESGPAARRQAASRRRRRPQPGQRPSTPAQLRLPNASGARTQPDRTACNVDRAREHTSGTAPAAMGLAVCRIAVQDACCP
jgi:hypothetical protein